MPAIRVIDRIRDQGDFGGALTDGYLLKYDASTDTFRLIVPPTGAVSSVTGSGAITCSPTTGAVVVSVAAASGSVPGTMSAADYTTLHAATSANTVSTLVQRDGSGSFAASSVTGLATPTNASDAATKGYVDGVASGLSVKAPVRVATTGGLPTNAATTTTLTASANAAFPAIDGVTLSVGDRILVMNETVSANNGLYTLTNAGSGTTKWVLTRTSDADTSAEVVEGMFVFVSEGTVNTNSGFVLGPTGGVVTLGTTNLTFVQFSGAGEITVGTGLQKSGNQLSISTGYGGQASITTVGSVGSGTWQATPIGVAYLGSGTPSAGKYLDGGSGWTTLPAYVSTVSVATANGFAGTVATATSTPTITLSTTVTGLLKGNGTAISAAVAGTDYVVPSGTVANVTGTVAIANGGTGQTSATAAFNALSPLTTLGDILYASAANTAVRLAGNTTTTKKFLVQTGTGTVSAAPLWDVIAVADVSGAAPLASPALTGTPTAPTAAAGTNTTQIATTAFVLGQGFLSGTVSIASGGTGQATQQAAINALTGTQAAGTYLRSDGTNATLAAVQAADLPGFDASGNGYPQRMTFILALGTNLANATNAANVPFIAPYAGKLVKWKVVASTNPVGGGFSFDLLRNGTSVFSAVQAIAANNTTVQAGSTFSTTAFAENDLFTVNISGAGTGVQNVVIEVVFLGRNS